MRLLDISLRDSRIGPGTPPGYWGFFLNGRNRARGLETELFPQPVTVRNGQALQLLELLCGTSGRFLGKTESADGRSYHRYRRVAYASCIDAARSVAGLFAGESFPRLEHRPIRAGLRATTQPFRRKHGWPKP